MSYILPTFIKLFFILIPILSFLTFYSKCVYSILSTIGLLYAILNVAWFLSKLYYQLSRKAYISPTNKAVLLTGCDSGFGHIAAKALDNYGFSVFAGCLFPNGIGAQKLYKSSSNRLRILSLDVTNNEDINAAIKEIEECELELWAVVNNAEITDIGLLEWGNDIDRFRKILEVNLFGAIRVTKACLPLIRKSKGRIVNLESILSRLTVEASVPYAISKHALKAFSRGLIVEFADFGVKVISIEPTLYQTNFINKEKLISDVENFWESSPLKVKSFYEKNKSEKVKNWLKFLNLSRKDITEVSKAIEEAVTVSNPLDVYFCGGFLDLTFFWIFFQFPDSLNTFFIQSTNFVWLHRILLWKKIFFNKL